MKYFFTILVLFGLVCGLSACGIYGNPERPDGATVYTYPPD